MAPGSALLTISASLERSCLEEEGGEGERRKKHASLREKCAGRHQASAKVFLATWLATCHH